MGLTYGRQLSFPDRYFLEAPVDILGFVTDATAAIFLSFFEEIHAVASGFVFHFY